MKKGIIRQYIFVGMIPVGVFGTAFSSQFLWLVPIGFIGCLINSIVMGIKLAGKADDLLGLDK
jgi:hypothetical protein